MPKIKSVAKRTRRLFSVRAELLHKAREAALAAVQIFNNPNVTFKSETFVVLMIIAWTYLMHAYYRKAGIDYRYLAIVPTPSTRKRYSRTKRGAFKYWELERCIDESRCPLDPTVVQNLKFLIGLRHEIEHQMTTRIDDLLSAKFQACCINYHEAAVSLFGLRQGIADQLGVSLQFAALSRAQVDSLSQHEGLPEHLRAYIEGFDGAISRGEFDSPKFAYRVIFSPKTVNHPGQADQAITFVKADSALATGINAAYTVIREKEFPKLLPSQVVALMKAEGFAKFGMNHHAQLWKERDAKNPEKHHGVQLAKTWYWYDSWVEQVRKHCIDNGSALK